MIYDSVIIRLLIRLNKLLGTLWANSALHMMFKKLSLFFGRLFEGSRFCNFIVHEGNFSRSWKFSGTGALFDMVFNLPVKVLRFIYLKLEAYFKYSLIFRATSFLLEYLHIGIALFLMIVVIVPQHLWSNLYNIAAAIFFLVFYYIKCAIKGNISKLTRVFDVFLALFVLAVLLAYIFSIIPSDSLRFLLFYLSCFIMTGVLALSIESRKQLMQVVEILLIAMTLCGLYGVWQSIVGVPVDPSTVDTRINEGVPGRIYSTMGNSNNFAVALSLVLPFFMTAVFNSKSMLKKVLFTLLAIPCLVSLIETYGRGSWIGFAAAVVVILFFKNKKLIPIMLLLAVVLFPFLPILAKPLYIRLMTIVNPADTSVSTRGDIYQTVLPVLKDYWVTGLGLGTDVFLKTIKNYQIFSKMIPAHSHDLYLQIWIETGIAGIAAFLGFITGIFKRSWKIIVQKRDPFISNILVAGLASIVTILVSGIPDYVWFYPRVMLLFWAVIGIMLSALGFSKASDGGTQLQETKGSVG